MASQELECSPAAAALASASASTGASSGSLAQLNQVLAASQQVRYSGRPAVDDFEEGTEVVGGHGNQILPGLYLGDQRCAGLETAESLTALGVTGIVNCTTDYECKSWHEKSIDYIRIAIHDNEAASLLPYLEGATTFIHKHIHSSAGGTVLVHCMRGASRSASVVLAYLMKYEGMSRGEAYVHAKRRRPLVSPNTGFWDQLATWEERLRAPVADASASLPETFDEAWCRQCHANYSTIGAETAFQGLGDAPPEIQRAALDAGLDFICGRMMPENDRKWLGAMCQACGDGAIDMLQAIISNEEFMESWCDDIKPHVFQSFLRSSRAS